jgi:2,5-diketo-D-gluconate reductase A
MEKIYASGKAKAIGVSNYLVHHLEELLVEASVVPAVDQIELHTLSRSAGIDRFFACKTDCSRSMESFLCAQE